MVASFISADCFKPPPRPDTQPRVWDRIAVPTAMDRRSDQKIYKRVSANLHVDSKYRAVVAELESHGLDQRKRIRIRDHIVPYGSADFENAIRPEVTGEQELAEARDQVEDALQKIWKDNLRLREEAYHRKNKRSSFDPAQLNWIPRKRHNTRWPINPPTKNTEFIAKLQPLIRFELHPSQIDEPAFFEQEDIIKDRDGQPPRAQQDGVPESSRVPDPEETAQQSKKGKPGHRRRTLRPSVGTISEAPDETLAFPMLTPTLNRVIHASPTKRCQAAADQSRTPTKVAETPLKDFTLNATPTTGDMGTSSQKGQFTVPSSPTSAGSNPGGASASDHTGQTLVSPMVHMQGSASKVPEVNEEKQHASPEVIYPAAEGLSTYATALPFFDQPIPDVQVEPEHESRRRLSLNNARRSDRTSDVKIIKRVHTWMTGATVGKKRRHSDMGALHQPVVSKRRHTLDVDAGMNPDIFGQLKIIPPPAETPPKPREAVHERSEAWQEHVSGTPTLSLESSAQGRVSASPENEETNESPPNEANENNEDDEDDEENVEGDSDMAYLQNFVQRSKSSKEDKRDDAPRGPILKKAFSKKRRSGSLNSATSDAGSPMAKMAIPAATITTSKPRVPLGEKDANKSPSPSKKRKLKGAEDGSMPIKKKNGRLVAPDLDDLEPATTKRKKRRKGIESDTDDVFNPEMDFNQVLTQRSTTGGAGARRSTRIATTHKAEPAPINVRVPGGVFVDSSDMPTVSTAGITNAVLQRKADQELANKTRSNTRKNRGGAVPVQMALEAMAERSGDGNADEFTITTDVLVEPKSRSGVIKTVRWDEILARVQDEETVAVAAAVESEESKAEVKSPAQAANQEDEDEDEDTQLPSPPQLRVVNLPSSGSDRPGNPVANQLATDSEEQEEAPTKNNPAPVRRSSRAATVSRLPKRGGGPSAPAAAPLTPIPTPKRSSLPAPSRVSKAGGSRGGAA
ncbi:hypothetical protein N0V82_008756, partial [Gnomoniopsis sp. IMI 355080]